MMPIRLTPTISPYEPIIVPAAGLHDPDRRRVYFFKDLLEGRKPRQRTIFIGRAPDRDIVLRHELTSRRHAIVQIEDDEHAYILPDGPANGLYVDGSLVTEPLRLTLGMQIRLGRALLLTTNASGQFLIAALTNDEFLAKSGDLYGSNRLASKHVGRSHSTIRRKRLPPFLRERIERRVRDRKHEQEREQQQQERKRQRRVSS